jgi:hypothetical protein
MKILIYNPHIQAHKIPIEILKKSLDQFDIQYKEVNEKESLSREIEDFKEMNILLHVSDHAKLETNNFWIECCHKCIGKNIVPMAMDFGYFDHGKTFLVDPYLYHCESSIKKEWPTASEDMNFNNLQTNIQEYRNKVIENFNKARAEEPLNGLNSENYCVIWTQQALHLLRECFYNEDKRILEYEWLTNCINQIKKRGLVPVIKKSPFVFQRFEEALNKLKDECLIFTDNPRDSEKIPFAIFDKDANVRLYAHSKFNIINSTSMSNEFILCNRDVIATGKSWFNDFDIFYEPKSWDTLLDYQQPNTKNQNKWINWWNSKQVPQNQIVNKIKEAYIKYFQ